MFLDSTQYADGITGALIVHPSEPSPPDFPTWDQDLVVQMNDWYHTFSSQLSAAYLSVRVYSASVHRAVPDTFFSSSLLELMGQQAMSLFRNLV